MVAARITLLCAVALAGQSVVNAAFMPPWSKFQSSLPVCGGMTGLECDDGKYCYTFTGECDASGVCLPKPTGCFFSSSQPVCGCDGISYKSSCEAHQAGVALQAYAACADDPIAPDNITLTPNFGVLQPSQLVPPPPPHKHRNVKCGQGAGECGDDQYCRMKQCGDTTGVCTDVPTFCPARRHSPVCGCDGFSYESMCEAARAKVAVASRGACPNAAPGATSVDDNTTILPPVEASVNSCVVGSRACSDPRKSCVARWGTCATDGVGSCVDASLMKCSMKKVCGCDGLTYSSVCDAYRNGVSVQGMGACADIAPLGELPPPPTSRARVGDGCEDDDDCGVSWMYCSKPRGQCGGVGNCTYRKTLCKSSDASKTTVCGCDGTTYTNECRASAAGVSVDQDGACFIATEEPSDEDGSCVSDVDCDSDEFCNFDQAECGNDSDRPGVCTTVPLHCPIPMMQPMPRDRPMTTVDVARDAAAAQAGGVAAGGGPGGRGGAGGRGGRGGRGHGGNSHSFPWITHRSGVCGCDGNTYTNTCSAHKAKMSVQHAGRCSSGSSDGGPGWGGGVGGGGWGGSWGGWKGGSGGGGGGGGGSGGAAPWLWGGRKWSERADKIFSMPSKGAQGLRKIEKKLAGGEE